MTTRAFAAAGLAAALCSVSLAAAPIALGGDDDEGTRTVVRISAPKFADSDGNITIRGSIASTDVNCRLGRTVTLYRTVNSGFGNSTKKLGKALVKKSKWTYKVRRSGTYVAKAAATDGCAAGTSRELEYVRRGTSARVHGDVDLRPRTILSIKKRAGENGSVVFYGTTRSSLKECRLGRKVTLYRTVDTGFTTITKKVGVTTAAKNVWKITSRRSGTYVAKAAATQACGEGISKKLEYERDLG